MPIDSGMPAVTVIIVNYDSGDLLCRCLSLLERQTLKPRSIFVVDNGSGDGSAQKARHFSNIRFFDPNHNLGFAAANNLAIQTCQTEYVALLNPDAFPEPTWLESLLSAARDCPDTAAFGSRQMAEGSHDLLDGVGDSFHISGKVWRQGKGRLCQAEDLVTKEIFSPCAAAALYRREAVLAVGGFDDDFFCYVEDVDLGFRLRLAGHKARYVPDAVVHHIGSATTGGQKSDFSVYHGHRNLVWTFVKNMPGALFWLLLPLHLLLNIAAIIHFMFRGQGRVILRAKIDAIKKLPLMLKKRRAIQRNRIASIKTIWSVLDKSIPPFR
ncbi:MAG: glycosyltransferase family 2 protein [Gammaproteobacteria bacterium]